MQLTLPQVARLFSVSENTVTRWVQQANLPAHLINSQYRFDRGELLEWAAINKQAFTAEIFREVNGDRVGQVSLADAMDRGGVSPRVLGHDRQEVLRHAIADLPLPATFQREDLLELLVARAKSGGAAIGEGIAIPHARYPVVLSGGLSLVRVCYLQHPLDLHAPDGRLVETIFLMICPTVHEHLQLLARLASVLHSVEFRQLLAARSDEERLVAAVRGAESESPLRWKMQASA